MPAKNKTSLDDFFSMTILTGGVTKTYNAITEVFGPTESAIIAKVHAWCQYNKDKHSQHHYVDGRWWTIMSLAEWGKYLPQTRERSIRDALYKLRKAGVLIVSQRFPKESGYRNWYSIDYQVLNAMVESAQTQHDERMETLNDRIRRTPSVDAPEIVFGLTQAEYDLDRIRSEEYDALDSEQEGEGVTDFVTPPFPNPAPLQYAPSYSKVKALNNDSAHAESSLRGATPPSHSTNPVKASGVPAITKKSERGEEAVKRGGVIETAAVLPPVEVEIERKQDVFDCPHCGKRGQKVDKRHQIVCVKCQSPIVFIEEGRRYESFPARTPMAKRLVETTAKLHPALRFRHFASNANREAWEAAEKEYGNALEAWIDWAVTKKIPGKTVAQSIVSGIKKKGDIRKLELGQIPPQQVEKDKELAAKLAQANYGRIDPDAPWQ